MAKIKECPIDYAIMTPHIDQDPPIWTCEFHPLELQMTEQEIIDVQNGEYDEGTP